MSLAEKVCFSERVVRRYARKAISWYSATIIDNEKVPMFDSRWFKVKAGLSDHGLTITYHVKKREKGTAWWSWKSYTVTDCCGAHPVAAGPDILLDDRYILTFTRSGIYPDSFVTGKR